MKPKTIKIMFGPLVFELRFSKDFDDVARFLNQWFSVGIISDEEREPDSIINFVGREEIESMADLDKMFFFRSRLAWEVYFTQTAKGQQNVFCISQLSRRLKLLRFLQYTPLSFYLPFRNSEFATLAHKQASDFVYHVFVPLAQSMLLKRDASFIHAGVLHNAKSGGFLFCGHGGSGKTSITSYLYLKHREEWSFLSDDFGIIDKQGKLYLNPMALNVYPYNTNTFPELELFIYGSMSLLERLNWWRRKIFMGPKDAMKRIAPSRRYIGTQNSSVHTIFHLERYGEDFPRITKMSDLEFASLEKNILLHELSNKQPLFTNTNTSIDEVGNSAERIYQSAARGKEIYLVHIPKNWDPHKLGEFFVDILQKLNYKQNII